MSVRSSEKVPKVNVEKRCSLVPAQELGDLVLSPEKDKTSKDGCSTTKMMTDTTTR